MRAAGEGRSRATLVLTWVALALYAAAALFVLTGLSGRRERSLDGVFYAGCVARFSADPVTAHGAVYRSLEAVAAPAEQEALERKTHYRWRIRNNPAQFELQLPFYFGKPAYLWTSALAHGLGASLIDAPYVASSCAFAILWLVLPAWLLSMGARPWWALLVSAALLSCPPVRDAALLATPDVQCALCLLLALWAGATRPWLALLAFAAACLTRPDAAIFGLFVGALWGLSREQRRTGALVVFVSSASALLATQLMHAYPWHVVMRHTFIKALSDPAQLGLSFTLEDYLFSVAQGAKGVATLTPAAYQPFLLLAVLTLLIDRGRRFPKECALLLTFELAALARWLVFPLLADRFFLPAYLVTVACGCVVLMMYVDAAFDSLRRNAPSS